MSESKGSFWRDVGGTARAFAYGLLGGLFGPLLALGGVVGLLYALTRELPAVKPIRRSDGREGKAIVLASLNEARASWARYAGELRGAMLELKARRQ
jgi:hypothetical protein